MGNGRTGPAKIHFDTRAFRSHLKSALLICTITTIFIGHTSLVPTLIPLHLQAHLLKESMPDAPGSQLPIAPAPQAVSQTSTSPSQCTVRRPRQRQIAVATRFSNSRRSTSRFGCRNCKLRRVKCDESFPVCLKCQRRGSICIPSAPPPSMWHTEMPWTMTKSLSDPWTGAVTPDKQLLSYKSDDDRQRQ